MNKHTFIFVLEFFAIVFLSMVTLLTIQVSTTSSETGKAKVYGSP